MKDRTSLYIDSSFEKPVQVSFCGGQISFYVHSKVKSEPNGDALGFFEANLKKGVLCLADGAGGSPGGNKASGEILKQFQQLFLKRKDVTKTKMRTFILDSFEKSNQLLLKQKTGALSTLSCVEVYGKKIRSYHAGDSQLFVFGQKGKSVYSSVAHSLEGYSKEAGVFDLVQQAKREDPYTVFNVLGDRQMRVVLGPWIHLKSTDTVFLCSDGVSDNLEEEEISQLVRTGSIEEASIQLAAKINELKEQRQLKKEDDVSFVMYRLNQS